MARALHFMRAALHGSQRPATRATPGTPTPGASAMTQHTALDAIPFDQLDHVAGGFHWPWDSGNSSSSSGGTGGFHWPWDKPLIQPTQDTGGVNRCTNPKYIPPMGGTGLLTGGGTVKLPVVPCVDIKKQHY
jgi:hypothetical protein